MDTSIKGCLRGVARGRAHGPFAWRAGMPVAKTSRINRTSIMCPLGPFTGPKELFGKLGSCDTTDWEAWKAISRRTLTGRSRIRVLKSARI